MNFSLYVLYPESSRQSKQEGRLKRNTRVECKEMNTVDKKQVGQKGAGKNNNEIGPVSVRVVKHEKGKEEF